MHPREASLALFVLFAVACVPAWWSLRSVPSHTLPVNRISALLPVPGLPQSEDVILRHSSFRVLFTVVSGAADDGVRLQWTPGLSQVLRESLEPLLRSLSFVGDFALESQLVHFWDFAEVAEPGVVMDDALKSKVFGQHWLREDVSSSPADKTIHLLLLIPPRKVTPLLASQNQQPDQLQSFWLPEVGGAVLDNSLFWSENIPGPSPSPLPEHVLQQSLRLLRPLLLRVLGFPEPMSASQEYLEQVAMLAYRAKMRFIRTALQAIPALLEEVSEMPIEKHLAEDVQEALDCVDQVQVLGQQSSSWVPKARLVGRCSLIVERVHRDPDMLAWLYFADESKIGIYAPFFGPVLLTLLLGVLRAVKGRCSSEKRKKKGVVDTQARD